MVEDPEINDLDITSYSLVCIFWGTTLGLLGTGKEQIMMNKEVVVVGPAVNFQVIIIWH